jgi:hypothetical protein
MLVLKPRDPNFNTEKKLKDKELHILQVDLRFRELNHRRAQAK